MKTNRKAKLIFFTVLLSVFISLAGLFSASGAESIPARWVYEISGSNDPNIIIGNVNWGTLSWQKLHSNAFGGFDYFEINGNTTGDGILTVQYIFKEIIPTKDVELYYKGFSWGTGAQNFIQVYLVTDQGLGVYKQNFVPDGLSSGVAFESRISLPTMYNGASVQGVSSIVFASSTTLTNRRMRIPTKLEFFDNSSAWANQWKEEQDKKRHEEIIGISPTGETTKPYDIEPSAPETVTGVEAPDGWNDLELSARIGGGMKAASKIITWIAKESKLHYVLMFLAGFGSVAVIWRYVFQKT